MKYKLKEILIIAGIIIITLLLAFYPKIQSCYSASEYEITAPEEEKPSIKKYVYVTLTGELIVDSIVLKIPYGYSYGNIINTIKLYSNKYSIIDYASKQRFTKDTILVIESIDINNDTSIDMSNKININTANVKELISLYGIGEKRAQYIIEYRKNKLFESFEELKKELGLSDAAIEKIKEQAFL